VKAQVPRCHLGTVQQDATGMLNSICWVARRRAGSYKQLVQREERRGMLGNVLEKMATEKAVMVQPFTSTPFTSYVPLSVGAVLLVFAWVAASETQHSAAHA
jgi:hypothetical protein